MGEYADYLIEQQIDYFVDKSERIELAASTYQTIRDEADGHDVKVMKHTEHHYSIRKGNYLVNVYPGKRRVIVDRGPANQRPFLWLDLPLEWTLEDAVKAFIEATKEEEMRGGN